MKIQMCVVLGCLFLLNACASTHYPPRYTENDWIDDVNPLSQETRSDWTLLGGNEDVYGNEPNFLSEMGHSAVN